MNNHIPTISGVTRSAIRKHIEKSEDSTDWPYLDIKGNVTIGVGFKSDDEDAFANLNLQVFKDGKWVEAKDGEKRKAYRQTKAEIKKRDGNLNVNANDYKGITNIRMAKPDQDALLDRKISENVENIKNGVGEDAWNKLNDGQKAAVTDIVYVNGRIEKFPNLRDAIKDGNAKKMAEESPFYTDSKTGRHDEGRLRRNYEALSGLNKEEAAKRLKEVLRKNDAARKNSPIRNATPPVKPMHPQKPGASGGDGPSDGKGPSGGDPSGDGQPQSHDLTSDPDAAAETKEFTPEQKKLMDEFGKSDGPLDEIIAKDPRDLTETEFLELKKEMIDLPAGPEQERLDEMATNYLEHKFGSGPVKYDAVGRMIDPEPIRPINRKPVPARTPDGEPLTGAVNKIGRVVAKAAGIEGSAGAVQGLQSGLNILKQVMLRDGGKRRVRTPGHDLKTDGIVGPKTCRALRFATSRLGAPKIEEGFALGRFERFARGVQTGRDDTRKLGATIGKTFGPLFRPLGTALPKQGKAENVAFQSTINDLGPKVFEPDAFMPIREDGLIGPRTETAFRAVLPAAEADRFTSRLGHNLGFFDFDDTRGGER